MKPHGPNSFSVAGRFRLIEVGLLAVLIVGLQILGTVFNEKNFNFPLNTGFRYDQVPFKTGFTAPYFKTSVLSGV